MSSEPSKGPWEYDEDRQVVWDADCLEVCDLGATLDPLKPGTPDWDKIEANARLIASAPTLKAENEALRKAVAEWREGLKRTADGAASYQGSHEAREALRSAEYELRCFDNLFNPILNPEPETKETK